MPATTPDGIPYLLPSDHPLEYAAQSQQLATVIPKVLSSRQLVLGTLSIPGNTGTPIASGYTLGAGDTGDGMLNYAAGIVTCAAAGYYAITGYINWTSNATGLRRLDILMNGAAWARDDRTFPAGSAHTLTVSGVYCAAGTQWQLFVLQQSGAALNIVAGRFNVTKLATV